MKSFIPAVLGASLLAVGLYAETTTLGCFANIEALIEVHPDIEMVVRNPPTDGTSALAVINMVGTLVYGKHRVAFWTRKCSTDLRAECKKDEKNCKQEYMLGKKPKS